MCASECASRKSGSRVNGACGSCERAVARLCCALAAVQGQTVFTRCGSFVGYNRHCEGNGECGTSNHVPGGCSSRLGNDWYMRLQCSLNPPPPSAPPAPPQLPSPCAIYSAYAARA
eukprot:649629-Prymnesium_polylepis.1